MAAEVLCEEARYLRRRHSGERQGGRWARCLRQRRQEPGIREKEHVATGMKMLDYKIHHRFNSVKSAAAGDCERTRRPEKARPQC
jgi:hypothetical protein